MSGLRERKKRQTREAILASAANIIIEKGYDATTIEAVAQSAEVGVGTVYNYFASKGDLLLAIFAEQTEEMMAAGLSAFEDHPDDVLAALTSVLNAYFDGLLQIDRRLLTEGFRVGFSKVGKEATGLMELDFRLIGQLAEVLTHFQARGLVRKSHPPQDQAMTIYGGTMVQVLMLVFAPELDVTAARAGMRQHLEIIVNGLRVPDTRGES